MNVKTARDLLYARSSRVCEVCARARGVEAHHRRNRSQGGLWSPENLLDLCSSCHRVITVGPALAYERGWSVRSRFDPADMPVWLAGHGWVLLDVSGGITPSERSAA